MFYASACLKGLGMINYCWLESGLLAIFLALGGYRVLGLSWMRGELLKLFIADNLIGLSRIIKILFVNQNIRTRYILIETAI